MQRRTTNILLTLEATLLTLAIDSHHVGVHTSLTTRRNALVLHHERLVSPVWEECLINLEQSLLIVHKQVKNVSLVPVGEVSDFDPIFGELCESEQAFFELFGLLTRLVKLLELLAIVDLVLKTPLHDLLPDFLNTVDEQSFKLVAFRAHIHPLSH